MKEKDLIKKDKTYEEGLNDAWELVKKIYKMSESERYEMFNIPVAFTYDILFEVTPQEALAKIEEYEKNNIKAGDEVRTFDNTYKGVVTVTRQIGDFYVLWDNGTSGTYTPKEVKKTGRTIDIKSFLAEIGKE